MWLPKWRRGIKIGHIRYPSYGGTRKKKKKTDTTTSKLEVISMFLFVFLSSFHYQKEIESYFNVLCLSSSLLFIPLLKHGGSPKLLGKIGCSSILFLPLSSFLSLAVCGVWVCFCE